MVIDIDCCIRGTTNELKRDCDVYESNKIVLQDKFTI